MNRAELGGPLLKAVSRSFYLTIRALPGRVQEPIGLAYLLARTSDTIADSAAAPATLRLRHLAAFGDMVATGDRAALPALLADIAPPLEAERLLLRQIPACLDWLAATDDFDRTQIRAVLATIIRGQSLDLQRFGLAAPGAVTALRTAAELDEYTYLVAGCVGEFWTRICVHHLPAYSTMPVERLVEKGIRFGQGLQLVNILRDLPEDLRQGRCYLPADELPGLAPGELLSRPTAARPTVQRWLARAREHLECGADYVRAVRTPRVRLACFLPWYLGGKTLDLLARQDPLSTPQRMKVPRSEVTRALWKGVWASFSDRPLATSA
jgi:farnesyl-diphosphate farnesyltransferase